MKKNYCPSVPNWKILWESKLCKVMKTTLFLILLAISQVIAVGTYSQNTRISLNAKNTTIRDVLAEIENKSDFFFMFDATKVNLDQKVEISAENQLITVILNELFKNVGISYSINNRQIALNSSQISYLANQPLKISGKVTDTSGAGLPGVSVVVKGTTSGTITDTNGNYLLSNIPENGTLQFSFVGMKGQEIEVEGRTTINITLAEETFGIDEVVAIGYGTMKKVDLTSSVSTIPAERLLDRPVSNVQQALQGLAPGVTVLDLGGAPGRSVAEIRVRGITTFNINNTSSTYGGYDLSKNAALVIVDGIEQGLNSINPDEIESISVLKDASSTAIYGSRATNGVILITTKRAKVNMLQVSYNGYYAIQQSINQPRMMGLEDYMRLQVAAYTNSGAALPAKYTEESIQTWVSATDREKYPLPNTWYETVLKSAPQHNHSFAVSGGNEFVKTRVSTRLMNQDGIAANYSQKLREIKLSSDIKASQNLTFTTDLNYRNNYSTVPMVEPFQTILHASLWAVPRYADGTYGLSSQGNNPLMYAEKSGISALTVEHLIANFKAEWEIIGGLKFSSQYGVQAGNTMAKNHTNAYVNTDKTTKITKIVANNSLSEVRNTLREYTWINLLTYEKSFEKQEVRVLAGYSEIMNKQTFLSAYRERFYNNDIQSISQGTNDGTKSNSGNDAEFALRSYFGRINYIFENKYLFEANGRYDGSSKFVGDKRYSFFPSFSAGWRISQENFWEVIKPVINDLKFRASWGNQGNQSVGLYSYYSSLVLNGYTFNGLPVQGYRESTLANRDLGWETTTQTNLGLDLSCFSNKLTFSAEYYNKLTKDILLNLGIPATVGLNAPPQNAGSVENKGFEFDLSYRGMSSGSDFNYTVRANMSINNNKVTDLKGTGPYIIGSDNYPRYIIAEGLPINTLWGYKTDGLFQTQEEINNYPTLVANSKPGDVKYLDLNDDKKIDAKDMTNIGSTFPKYTFGLSTELAYKNFDLNILVQGVSDVDTRLGGALSDHGNFEAFAHEILTNNYWTPQNTAARFPRPLKFDFRNGVTSDRTVIDGSYVRVKNIQIGYSIPPALTNKVKINKVRFYVSGTNLITFSKLNEWNLDPEVEPGVAVYYPQTSLYTVGVNVHF